MQKNPVIGLVNNQFRWKTESKQFSQELLNAVNKIEESTTKLLVDLKSDPQGIDPRQFRYPARRVLWNFPQYCKAATDIIKRKNTRDLIVEFVSLGAQIGLCTAIPMATLPCINLVMGISALYSFRESHEAAMVTRRFNTAGVVSMVAMSELIDAETDLVELAMLGITVPLTAEPALAVARVALATLKTAKKGEVAATFIKGLKNLEH
jgi:hypothetical protein